jgi:cyclophilin family peptidyl-prolyl cis-trans isomerase
MSYTSVKIHKVRPGHLLESGDFLFQSGHGHESIYGPEFDDENFILKHRKYSVGMVNTGPHTNGG